jgi:hypothetical protein
MAKIEEVFSSLGYSTDGSGSNGFSFGGSGNSSGISAAQKIAELGMVVKSGARNNKYRIQLPYAGKEVDILCHEINSPGRSIGTAEVFLKGRKYILAGDRSDDNSTELTFYNDPGLQLRTLFLNLIEGVQPYYTPNYVSPSDHIVQSVDTIGGYLDQIRYNLSSISAAPMTKDSTPWYQTDIVIEQLDDKMNVTSKNVLMDAFVSSVGDIQYTDETGEVSSTTVTFTHNGNIIV